MSDLSNPNAWVDGASNTPPDAWDATLQRFVIDGTLTLDRNRMFYLNDPAAEMTFQWSITTASAAATLVFEYNSATGQKSISLGTAVDGGVFVVADADPIDFWWRVTDNVDNTEPQDGGVVHVFDPLVNFNCECDDDAVETDTLANLRIRLARRLGYSAQAANLPPGTAELFNDFLIDAQTILYKRTPTLRTSRFYTWTLTPGVRFYGIRENDDVCAKKLDPYLLEWVGIEDLNGSWYELVEGIPPEFYTSLPNSNWPTRYEIRQCIEIYPPPADAYKLRIKGRYGLLPFSADADKTTLPASPVFHWALGMGKRHSNKPDAQDYFDIALKEVGDYVAGAHGTRRYVQRAQQPMPLLPKPIMKDGF